MNEAIARLHPYPFERLAGIRAEAKLETDKSAIDLSIGEPKHPTPQFILEQLSGNLTTTGKYPVTRGTPALREAIQDWLIQRFHLPAGAVSADLHILPVNGTREALFAIAQCIIDRRAERPLVLCPNPFYQIYEGAALLAGAQPWFLNCLPGNGFRPDFDSVPESIWRRCQLLYLCTPGNPTGSILAEDQLEGLMGYADRYDFVVAADECYSEIYPREGDAPIGLLETAARSGREDFRRCLVFHSLSKRSNAPGMRSGFVAGDADLIANFLRYRTYHGCAMPLYTQAASTAAWRDEQHVCENRAQYRRKFDAVLDILAPVTTINRPEAGFYLWLAVPGDDVAFARGLLERQNVTVLPGSFLAREADGCNPGRGFVRIALVAPLAECITAAERLRDFMTSLSGRQYAIDRNDYKPSI